MGSRVLTDSQKQGDAGNPAGGKKTIMIVDDSASVRLMVNFALSGLGFEIIEASNGIDALKKSDGRQIDLLITDVNMPEMDGLSLAKKVRANPRYQSIPIIFLTTVSQADKKREGKEAGANGWLVKPFNPEQLAALVKKVM